VILLGLGLSTALLAYMFLNAFGNNDGGSTGYNTGYGHDSSGYGSDYYHRRGDWNTNSRGGKVITLCYSQWPYNLNRLLTEMNIRNL